MSVARENVEEKACRLLVACRVRVLGAARWHVLAQVAGDHGRYAVTCGAGRWSCAYLAFGRCSHVAAVQLVTGPASVISHARRGGRQLIAAAW